MKIIKVKTESKNYEINLGHNFLRSIPIKKLINNKDFLDKILIDGHKKANDIASNKVKKIHELIGF